MQNDSYLTISAKSPIWKLYF